MKTRKSKKTVFVTGSDGMLGSNVVRELLTQGYRVKAMVQPGRNPKTISDLKGVEIVYGDLLDWEKIKQLMRGCDSVIHTAAYAASWPSRSPRYFDINVTGTQNVINAALFHRVNRFVHISSSNTQGFSESKKTPGTETTPWRGDQGMDYALSKKIAHEKVEKAIAEQNLPAVFICPGFMFGAFDTGPTSGQLLISAWNQDLKFCTKGGKNFVSASDVAKATVNALTLCQVGETYICGNQNLEFKELFEIIEDVTGIPQPKRVIPAFIVEITGMIMDFVGKITGKKPPLSFAMARNANLRMYYRADKAIKQLKMPQTDLRTAIKDAYRWFGENGYLKNYDRQIFPS
ncbi:MAG: NAD-dependent epimerase/dehydratase family protein [Bacteroidia bacterium]|nr:NAD-dependent epimerase/dehydratase family protein [Bacteroidia bacterium]